MKFINKVTIVTNLVQESKYDIKCPYPMQPEGVTIHNTASRAAAADEIAYMRTNNLEKSFHYCVDEKEIIQGLPLDRNGWHAGDGNGAGNRKTIGVEIARSMHEEDALFAQAEENAAELVANICKERGWGIDKVYTHNHWSGKNCPHKTLELGWERFLAKVDKYLVAMSQQETEKGDFEKMTDLQKELFVKNVLYVGLLDRQAEPEGVAYWVKRLNGATINDVMSEFMKTEEYRQRTIEVAYERLLGRKPDAEGMEYWTERLKSSSADELYNSIKKSEEYKSK